MLMESQNNPGDEQLAALLQQAAGDTAYRPRIFSLLITTHVWVALNDAHARLELSTLATLPRQQAAEGGRIIPFFTGKAALLQIMGEDAFPVRVPAHILFSVAAGETLSLNPTLPVGMLFPPEEVARLLAQQNPGQETHRLLLSEISEPPAMVITALTALFSEYKQVRRAFMAQVKEHVADKPVLLIGIETDGDPETIIHAVGSAAAEALPEGEAVDVCQVVAEEPGVSHFFTAHITPFYQRRWGSFLREYTKGNGGH